MDGKLSLCCKTVKAKGGTGAVFRRLGMRKRRLGFTLTEVLVTASLLLIAMVPMLKGLTAAHFHSVRIEHKTKSLALAQAKLADIKASSIYSYSSSFAETNTSLDGAYLCRVADSTVSSNLRNMVVSVGYDTDGSNTLTGSEVLVTLNTLIAKRW